MENKIRNYVEMYSPDGPKIWFTHNGNKKTYLLGSKLHEAADPGNGSGKDGVVATPYDNEGNRTWRSCFIILSKIDQIWREPDVDNPPLDQAAEYQLNENEYPIV